MKSIFTVDRVLLAIALVLAVFFAHRSLYWAIASVIFCTLVLVKLLSQLRREHCYEFKEWLQSLRKAQK